MKNQSEDQLFKNEDEMYQTDHRILQLENMIAKLTKELENAKEWKDKEGATFVPNSGMAGYKPRYLRDSNYSFIIRWYQDNISKALAGKIKVIVQQKPVELIENINERFTK